MCAKCGGGWKKEKEGDSDWKLIQRGSVEEEA